MVEMMVGLAVSTVVLGGVFSVIGQLSQSENDNRVMNLLNQTYFQGVQTARSNVRIKQFLAKLSPALTDCLANHGEECQKQHQAAPEDLPATGVTADGAVVNDNTLNGTFGFYGPCADTEPHCLIRRTTKYTWECPNLHPTNTKLNNYCSGVRIEVTSALLPNAGNARRNPLKARVGSFVLSARDFVNKGNMSLRCAGASAMISRLDFSAGKDQDTCSTFSAGTGCAAMPLNMYTTAAGECLKNQDKPCDQGYAIAGLFKSQMECVGTVDVTSTFTPPATCPSGGEMQANGACLYANRWCLLSSANPASTIGFSTADNGAVHGIGCEYGGTTVPPGTVVPTGIPIPPFEKCVSGPASAFPLPNDPYCPAAK